MSVKNIAGLLLLLCFTCAEAITPEEAMKGAEQGDAAAEYALGTMYCHGTGVPKDVKKGIEWLEKAADQGNVGAQYDLGVINYNGRDVPQDFKKAFALFSKTADQGNQDGKYNMGVMYLSGQGVTQDHQNAFELFSAAADSGVKNAQIHLAGMYLFGDGTSKDYVLAYKWALIADLIDGTTIKGNMSVAQASHTGPIKTLMNKNQVATSEKLVDDWLNKRNLRREAVLTYPITTGTN